MNSEKEKMDKLEKKLVYLSSNIKKHKPPEYVTSKIISHLYLPEKPHPPDGENTSFFLIRLGITFAVVVFLCIALVNKIGDKRKIEVKFAIINQDAQTISLVGDFNKWDINANKFIKSKNSWYLELKLKPGRYQYMFVIDGKNWINDKKAPESINDCFGHSNSILDTTKI